MKKIIYCLLASVIMVNISGCSKIIDYFTGHPGGTGTTCRLDKITNVDSLVDAQNPSAPKVFFENTTCFRYDGNGNLTHINTSYTGVPDQYRYHPFGFDSFFKYDSLNRLVLYLEMMRPSHSDSSILTALEWHKYTYIDRYNIIDSFAMYAAGYPEISNTPIDGFDPNNLGVEHITLDVYGRIIRVDAVGGSYAASSTYTYNSAGNLIRPGISYTNKVNLYQTSKTLMFVTRDYSVNTPVGYASAFNSANLPVKLNHTGRFPVILSLFNYDPETGVLIDMDYNIQVFYDCE